MKLAPIIPHFHRSRTQPQLGGLYIIDAPDLDTALEWAARSPAASLGGVEVRPVIPAN